MQRVLPQDNLHNNLNLKRKLSSRSNNLHSWVLLVLVLAIRRVLLDATLVATRRGLPQELVLAVPVAAEVGPSLPQDMEQFLHQHRRPRGLLLEPLPRVLNQPKPQKQRKLSLLKRRNMSIFLRLTCLVDRSLWCANVANYSCSWIPILSMLQCISSARA